MKVLSGKDRGKTGKVTRAMPDAGKALIDGLNLVKKHVRPRKQGEKGQRISIPAPIDISNLMMVCPKCSKPSRVGFKLKDENKFRICKKCGSEI